MRVRLLLSQIAALGAIAIFSATLMAQTPDSQRVSTLLQHAREHAQHAELDSDALYAYTQSGLSWQSHSRRLNLIREHVNELGKDARDLTDARAEASPWQQDAIDHINPLLREMADHLTATITHLNENKDRVHLRPFADYARGNYELSQKLRVLIDDYADYAQATQKADALEQKLAIPEAGSPGQR